MACILDRKTSPSGKILEWVPEQIPSTKPFIHIVTSPSEPIHGGELELGNAELIRQRN